MRTKEQHEKEKILVGELKKIEQRIKKEEKEERNYRKLVYDESSFAIPTQVAAGQVLEAVAGAGGTVVQRGDPSDAARKDRGAGSGVVSGVYLRSQVLSAPLPSKKEHLQKKFDIVLSEIHLDPTELQPTQAVAETYQELVNEILKMFALENYIKQLRDQQSLINEAKEEKRVYLEAGRKQIHNFIETNKALHQNQIQQL